jgi:hypothetical protein
MNFASEIWNKPAAAAAAAGDVVTKSLRFDSASSSKLTWTPASSSSATSYTISLWAKRGDLGAENCVVHAGTASGNRGHIRFNSDDTLELACYNGSWFVWIKTTAKFRDPSAFYHICGEINTTNGTAKLYINGVQQTALSQNTADSSSTVLPFGANTPHQIGVRGFGSAGYFGGYAADIYGIDGTALTPTSFAEEDATTGQWKPKAYDTADGAYGNNGFHLEMKETGTGTASSSTIGADTSGEDNHFTTTNLAASDVVEDTPTDNHATWNPLIYRRGGSHIFTYSEGNTKAVYTGGVAHAQSTIASSGRHYAEFDMSGGSSGISGAGVVRARWDDGMLNSYANSYGGAVFGSDGDVTSPSGATSHTAVGSDRQGIAFDGAANKVDFYIVESDGTMTLQKSLTSSDNIDFDGGATFTITSHDSGATTFNGYFSSDKWWGGAPTIGGNATTALSTGNLPTPTIAKPAEHFNTVLYTGDNTTGRDIEGVGFRPDFTWLKNRSGTNWHTLFDSVRGVTSFLWSNSDVTEGADGPAFMDDGITVDHDASSGNNNASGTNYVIWNWKAGTSFDAGGGSGTGSKNATAGFSIAKWEGDGEDGPGGP